MTAVIIGGLSVPVYPTVASLPDGATFGSLAVVLEDDSLYEFDSAGTWKLIGPNTTSGTVTSVGLAETSSDALYAISGSPVTVSGTIDITLNTRNANLVFAGPDTGSAAEPAFRSLVVADIPDLSNTYIPQTEAGAANGVATLDPSGKIPASQLPSVVLQYKGSWDPTTNTPTLADGVGTSGWVYRVSAQFIGPIAGLSDPSMVNFQIGNLVIYSGSVWQQVASADGVTSVNGAIGDVTVNAINQLTGDVTAGPATLSESVAATIAANAVTNAKLAQAASHTLKGNNTAGTANVTDLTPSQVKAILAIVAGDVAYTPAVSANWTVQPTTVAEALDWIAAQTGML